MAQAARSACSSHVTRHISHSVLFRPFRARASVGVPLTQAFGPPIGMADLRPGLRYFAPLGLKDGCRRYSKIGNLCLSRIPQVPHFPGSNPSPTALRSPLSPAEREMFFWRVRAPRDISILLRGEKVADGGGRMRGHFHGSSQIKAVLTCWFA